MLAITMSIGIGAHANKVLEDNDTVIYEYGGYNLNNLEYRNEKRLYDGIIVISQNCFVESEIHEKIKKMPSGRKKRIRKRIAVPVEYEKMIEDGSITVENCSNCWKVSDDEKHVDIMALRILFYVFLRYQEEGKVPDSISYNV